MELADQLLEHERKFDQAEADLNQARIRTVYGVIRSVYGPVYDLVCFLLWFRPVKS